MLLVILFLMKMEIPFMIMEFISLVIAPFATGRNAVAEGLENINYLTGQSLGARTSIDITILKELKFTSNLGMDQETSESFNYLNPLIGDGAPGGALTRGNSRVKSYTFNQLLNYTKRFDAHNFEVLAGHENYDRETSGTTVSVRGPDCSRKNIGVRQFQHRISSTGFKLCNKTRRKLSFPG
jgi:hypothetical protein